MSDYQRFTTSEFRILLAWLMVSDPWPLRERDREIVLRLLNDECERRDYNDWVHAYHELCGDFDE